MTYIARGKVDNGGLLLAERVPLPDGAEVIVQIEPATTTVAPPAQNFASLPFFGMWADRSDLPESTTWVREQRQHWQQRASRPD